MDDTPGKKYIPITEEMLDHSAKERYARINFETGMNRCPRFSIVMTLVLAAVYAAQVHWGGLLSLQSVINSGALYRNGVLDRQVWRLLSGMFLHGSLGHLIGNCIALYMLGMICEHAYGEGQTIVLYFVSGLGASVLSVMFKPGPAIGASGAIFGLMGGAVAFLYNYKEHFFIRDRRIGFVLLVWALYQIAKGFLTPYIDNNAHIGGFVMGIITGLTLSPRLFPEDAPADSPGAGEG